MFSPSHSSSRTELLAVQLKGVYKEACVYKNVWIRTMYPSRLNKGD